MIDSPVGGNISYKLFDMPEKRDRYEEEIEDLPEEESEEEEEEDCLLYTSDAADE